jgi:hypothetical protein
MKLVYTSYRYGSLHVVSVGCKLHVNAVTTWCWPTLRCSYYDLFTVVTYASWVLWSSLFCGTGCVWLANLRYVLSEPSWPTCLATSTTNRLTVSRRTTNHEHHETLCRCERKTPKFSYFVGLPIHPFNSTLVCSTADHMLPEDMIHHFVSTLCS